MKQLEKISQEIAKMQTIADRWACEGEISTIERDMMLDKLRRLYDAVLDTQAGRCNAEQKDIDMTTVAAVGAATQESVYDRSEEIGDRTMATTDPEQQVEQVKQVEQEEPLSSQATAQEQQSEPEEHDEADKSAMEEPASESSDGEENYPINDDYAGDFEEDILVLDDMFFNDEESESIEQPEEIDQPEEIEQPEVLEEPEEIEDSKEPEEPEEPEDIEEAEEAEEPMPEIESNSEVEEQQIIEEQPIIEEQQTIEEQPATTSKGYQQTNLFDIDNYTAQRRSHRRLMSLYDEELFDQTPAKHKEQPSPIEEVVVEEVIPQQTGNSEAKKSQTMEDFDLEQSIDYNTSESQIEESIIEEVAIEAVAEEQNITIDNVAEQKSSLEIVEVTTQNITTEDSAQEQAEISTVADFPTEQRVVIGDVMMSDQQILGDTIAATQQPTAADAISHTSINSLCEALGINDRYTIIAELFGGNEEMCDKALKELDNQESLEDAIIFIESNFSWHPSSEAAAMITEILERKFS